MSRKRKHACRRSIARLLAVAFAVSALSVEAATARIDVDGAAHVSDGSKVAVTSAPSAENAPGHPWDAALDVRRPHLDARRPYLEAHALHLDAHVPYLGVIDSIVVLQVDTLTLVDDVAPLGSICVAAFPSPDVLVVYECGGRIHLFHNFRQERVIGSRGQGPCEYEDVSALDVRGDTLAVLDTRQRRLLEFRVSTGECTHTRVHDEIGRSRGLRNVGRKYYLLRYANMHGMSDEKLISEVDGESVSGVGPSISDLEASLFRFPLSAFVPSDYSDGILYFVPHLSSRLWMYDVVNDDYTWLPIHIALPDRDLSEVSSLSEGVDLLNESIELPFNVFVRSGYVAVVARFRGSMIIRFYTRTDGRHLGTYETDRLVVRVDDEHIYHLGQGGLDDDYAHRIIRARYEIRR